MSYEPVCITCKGASGSKVDAKYKEKFDFFCRTCWALIPLVSRSKSSIVRSSVGKGYVEAAMMKEPTSPTVIHAQDCLMDVTTDNFEI